MLYFLSTNRKGWKSETDFLLNANLLGFRRLETDAGAAAYLFAAVQESTHLQPSYHNECHRVLPPVFGAACAPRCEGAAFLRP